MKREESLTQSTISTTLVTSAGNETPGVAVKHEEPPSVVADQGVVLHEYEDLTAGMGIYTVSNHPELETVVREALNHMLLGSRPRGARITDGFARKALTNVAPAIFDTDRLRVILFSSAFTATYC